MKKFIYLPFLLTLLCLMSMKLLHSQKVEITPQYGYQIGAKLNYYGGYIKVKGSDQYGLTVGVNPSDDISVEFMWAQQNTSVNVKDAIHYPQETEITDAKIDHFQFGAIHMFGYSDARPFAGLSAGWSTFNPEEEGYFSNTSFSLGVTGGLKYFFNKRVGLRLQAQLMMPINWGGIYVGSGGGGVTVGGSILQLNFSGGLIIGLGS